MSKIIKAINMACRGISKFNEKLGIYISFVMLLLVFLLPYEAIARYVFNAPTVWTRDLALQIQGLLIGLGGGYVLLVKGHVVVDLLVSKLSTKNRAIVNLVTMPVIFFSVGILFWLAVQHAYKSVLTKEAFISVWAPPIYPLKILIALGILLLLLQVIVNFIEQLKIALGR